MIPPLPIMDRPAKGDPHRQPVCFVQATSLPGEWGFNSQGYIAPGAVGRGL